MEGRIIGIRTVTSPKSGKQSSTIYLSTPFSQYEKANADLCRGESIITEWTTLDVSDLKPGMLVNLFYAKTKTGKAILSGFQIVKG